MYAGCGEGLTILFLFLPAGLRSGSCQGLGNQADICGTQFYVFVQVIPADALHNPEPGGDQGALFTHNVVHGCAGQSVINKCSLYFVLYLFYVFSAKYFSPSWGCKGWHHQILVFIVCPSPPPVMRVVREKLFARHIPCNSACVPLYFHDGLPRRNNVLSYVFFCRRAFSASPIPATPEARGWFSISDWPCL